MSIQNSLNSKLIAIAVLALLLLIPLAMVKGVIKERLSYRESVHKDIATSWTGAQQITGLILVVPYKVRIHKTLWDKERKISRQEVQERWRQFYLVAEQLNLQAEVNTEMRYRGIYGVPVYTAELELNGSFSRTTR